DRDAAAGGPAAGEEVRGRVQQVELPLLPDDLPLGTVEAARGPDRSPGAAVGSFEGVNRLFPSRGDGPCLLACLEGHRCSHPRAVKVSPLHPLEIPPCPGHPLTRAAACGIAPFSLQSSPVRTTIQFVRLPAHPPPENRPPAEVPTMNRTLCSTLAMLLLVVGP